MTRENSFAGADAETRLPRVLEPEVMDTHDEAEDYDAMDHAAVNGAFCDAVLALRPNASWVLDLGTGTARIPITFCSKNARLKVVGTDLASHMIRVAQRNVQNAGFSERITLRLDDAKAPTIASEPFEPFDIVCSNSVVHHLPDPAAALAAWWARVPPGALFFVRDLLRPTTTAEVAALVEKHGGKAPAKGDPARASYDRQLELFRASLCAALRVDEVSRIVAGLGIPESAVSQTSDRHYTIAYEKPR